MADQNDDQKVTQLPEPHQERLVKKVDGGILVEDDGHFLNFMPDPGPQLGNIMGFGCDDDDTEGT